MISLPFEIDILAQSERWQPYPYIEKYIYEAIGAAVSVLEEPRLGELSVLLSTDLKVQILNRKYRNKNKPTNVLSFPIAPPAPMLGDIVLAYETVEKEAEDKGVSLEAHMMHLLIHGFLHLQGYDHENESDAEVMEALEIKALKTLKISNPYV